MKFTTLVSLTALTVGALSGPLAAAPAMIDIGAAFEQALADQDGIVTVRQGSDDRREERAERRERRDDRREDRRDRREDRDEDDESDDDHDEGNDDDEYDDSGNDGNDDSGNDGWDDSDNDGWDDSGNDGTDDSGSGRDEPRIPGGSGCDDPEDILEHPECQV